MSFAATVYRVLVASPGDLHEERGVIEEVVNSWNASHAAAEGIVLLPVRWETHAVPEYGDRPQAILNRRLVADCDILIGAFWTRVGTPTGRAESGTIEEIEQFAKAEKPALLYFSSRQIDPDRVDLDQLKRVRELRSRLEQVALIGQFSSPDQLGAKLTRDLIQQVRRFRDAAPERSSLSDPHRLSPAQPTDPIKQSAPSWRGLDRETLDRLYQEYWERFARVFRESNLNLRAPTPGIRNYVRVSLSSSDMRMNAFASVRDRVIGVELVLRTPACSAAYVRLHSAREEIEREIGQKLEWNELVESNRIILSVQGFDPAERDDWQRQHEVLIDLVTLYNRVLVSRVTQ